MRFTVLIPAFDNGAVIKTAIESVQYQTIQDFELFIVLDGAPGETLDIVTTYAENDSRIRIFNFPKGERHGEAWRHEALQSASGTNVCYLCDDDLYLPNHLEVMEELLTNADFANVRHSELLPSFCFSFYYDDIAKEETQAKMLGELYNFFGLSSIGHSLSAYNRLPVGWSPAPEGIWTDLYMIRKWVSLENVRVHSGQIITHIHQGRNLRLDHSLDTLIYKNEFWFEFFSDPFMCQALAELSKKDEYYKLPISEIVKLGRALRATMKD